MLSLSLRLTGKSIHRVPFMCYAHHMHTVVKSCPMFCSLRSIEIGHEYLLAVAYQLKLL